MQTLNNWTRCDTYDDLADYLEELGEYYLFGLLNCADSQGLLAPVDAEHLLSEHGEELSNYVDDTKDDRLQAAYLVQWLGY